MSAYSMRGKMKLEILLSCMHQKDLSLVQKSHISGDVLLINQTDEETFFETEKDGQHIRMISTKERGLSRSRNMAIRNAQASICLLSDDDEQFVEAYEKIITEHFDKLPDADIIAFELGNKETRLKPEICQVGRLESLRLCSCQLAFRRESILAKNLAFDPYMGSGSGNGCGEENKFLLDCLKAGLKIYYVPAQIAVLDTQGSEWFFGFDEKFFYQRGATTRYMLGLVPAIAYGLYYIFTKRDKYRETISMKTAAKALAKGIWDNTIYHQKSKAKDE